MERPNVSRLIAQGIRLDEAGQVSVDADVGRVLFDLAIELENVVPHPVDVQHVLAAIVLAERDGHVNDQTAISSSNEMLRGWVQTYLPVVIEQYGDQLGAD